MWRSSGKLPRSVRLSRRQLSSLTQKSVVARNIGRTLSKSGKHNSLRYLASSSSGGAGSGGKVALGAAVAVTGGVAGSLYYAKNNVAFRNNVEEKLPFAASVFDAVIGKPKSDNNLKSPAIRSSQFPDSPEKKDKPLSQEPALLPEAKPPAKGEVIPPVATVSSVDQIAVSSVDLDISNTVEKEVLDVVEVEEFEESGRKESENEATGNEKNEGKEVEKENGEVVEKVDEKTEVAESNEIQKESEPAADNTTTEMMAKSSFEIALQTALATASQLGDNALDCHERAIDAVRLHRKSLSEALQRAENDTLSKEHWETLGALSQTKNRALGEARSAATQLNDVIEKVQMLIGEGKEKGLGTTELASEMVARLTYAIQEAKNSLKETENEGGVLKQFQDMVEESKQHLREQLASIRPDMAHEKADANVDEGLLAYAQNRIRVLEEALEQREVEQRKVIEEVLTKQQKEQEKLAEMRLKHELETLKNELTNLMKQKEATMLEEHEQDIRQQLRRQATVFGDHLNDVLKVQARELGTKHASEKREELLLQRQEFELKLRGNLARLEAIMNALQNRADIEQANTRAQELWLACQSLATAITGLSSDHSRLFPMRSEVEKIRRITAGDEMMSAVLDSLPEEVLDRGVFPEQALRRRFPRVRKICQQVAMIGEQGGGLWSYLVSYLQSFLVFDVHAVTKPDLIDPAELDTHTILSLASDSLAEGDTEQAVRYMTQLQGEPRRVARDWVQEARLFLEAKQVARLLTSFASAYNIGAEQ